MYAIDLTVEFFFYFLYTSAYLGFTHENEKKIYITGLVFEISAFKIYKIGGKNALT